MKWACLWDLHGVALRKLEFQIRAEQYLNYNDNQFSDYEDWIFGTKNKSISLIHLVGFFESKSLLNYGLPSCFIACFYLDY